MEHRRARLLFLPLIVIAGTALIARLLLDYRDEVFRQRAIEQTLVDELQPVAIANCALERFGEANDGGYLMCGNLLSEAVAGYSYGISGYDGWGCDVSRRLALPVHQYDCFDTRRTSCPDGRQIFHEECVGAVGRTDDDGRVFSTVADQVSRNGDGLSRLVVKMDVEGAEWESLEAAPTAVLDRIDQLAIEFHGADDRAIRVIERLKAIFFVAHLHYNNYGCRPGPLPSDAYEVLFVHKRLGRADSDRRPTRPHPLDAPNNPKGPDCQR